MQINTRTSNRRSKVEPNLFFFSGYMENVVRGVRFDEVIDPNGTHNIALPTLIVGPKSAGWSKFIRPGKGDAPLYDANKIWRGSIIKDPNDANQKRDIMVEYRDENANYVLVRTGVRLVDRGGTLNKANFWQQLADRDVKAVRHGAYSFDKEAVTRERPVRVATAEDIEKIAEGKLSEIPINPLDGAGTVAAERMRTFVFGRQIKGVGCPETAFVLWKMPFGAVLLVRDVDGTMSRLVSEKLGVTRRDGVGYGEFFDELDQAYHAARAKILAEGDPNYKGGISLTGKGAVATA